MNDVFFKPWIGPDYESGGIFGKKILVVGEAHICGADCEDCGIGKSPECEDLNTPGVVKNYLQNHSGEWSRTFRKFERALFGNWTDDSQSEKIWNSVAFYNYIQRALTKSRISPEWQDFKDSEEAFFTVIDTLEPDLIIVWGLTRMYDNLPAGDRWIKGDYLEIEETEIKNGYYKTSKEKEIRVLWICHPSAAFSIEKWHNVIKSEL